MHQSLFPHLQLHKQYYKGQVPFQETGAFFRYSCSKNTDNREDYTHFLKFQYIKERFLPPFSYIKHTFLSHDETKTTSQTQNSQELIFTITHPRMPESHMVGERWATPPA